MPTAQEKPREFASLRKVRERMQSRADEALDIFFNNLRNAGIAQDYDVVQKGIEWYFAHIGKDTEGETVISQSIDAVKQVEGQKGPIIQVGVAIGGVTKQKELPAAEVIDLDSDAPPTA